jgi:hypothetical protein
MLGAHKKSPFPLAGKGLFLKNARGLTYCTATDYINVHGGWSCIFIKHGKKHDVYKNPRTGIEERVPRHTDINETLANFIIKNLS